MTNQQRAEKFPRAWGAFEEWLTKCGLEYDVAESGRIIIIELPNANDQLVYPFNEKDFVDFFDEKGIYANVEHMVDIHNGERCDYFSHEINLADNYIYDDTATTKFPTRAAALESVVDRAFEILEERMI